MEKKQSELCFEILRRFHKAGILEDLILIGSWCVYFYHDYFSGVSRIDRAALRTRDIDFLVDNPSRKKKAVNVPALLKDLGFIETFRGSEGYLKLDHPDLLLEFLVPEKGKETNQPHPLPKLGLNAEALRFLGLLSARTIKVKVEDFHITLPHPANFALHKLIIAQRRLREEKALKDISSAIGVIRALLEKKEAAELKRVFDSIPRKWQAQVMDGLKDSHEEEILELFSSWIS